MYLSYKLDYWRLFLFFGAVICISLLQSMFFVADAYAASGTSIGSELTVITNKMLGSTGKAVACVGIVFLGTMALFGKVSPPLFLMVSLGVALVFGGKSITEHFWSDTSTQYITAKNAADPFAVVFTNLLATVTGADGKAFATLMVIFLGVGALMGKISHKSAIITALGLAAIFGAAGIVETLMAKPCGGYGGAGSGSFGGVFCNLVAEAQGAAGKAFASVIVATVGIGAMMGKVSWGNLILVAAGIGLIFGGQAIIQILAPDFALGQCGFAAKSTSGVASGQAFVAVINNIIGLLTKGPGAAIATLAIIVMGIGTMMGKISQGTVFTFAVGLVLVFSATNVVKMLGVTTPAGVGATGTSSGAAAPPGCTQ